MDVIETYNKLVSVRINDQGEFITHRGGDGGSFERAIKDHGKLGELTARRLTHEDEARREYVARVWVMKIRNTGLTYVDDEAFRKRELLRKNFYENGPCNPSKMKQVN